MTRTVYVLRDGKLVEKAAAPPLRSPTVMIDCYSKNPTVSPVDGSVLDSRRKLANHNARNDVIDVGNDPAVLRRPKPKGMRDVERGEARSRAIHRAFQQLGIH